uniref:Uncharacterized protein n=1 Tax=Rhizochromulina marina TaxID=1034831 RepID=A0A7S2WUH3_9STRA|mmetsp:Transcript_6341/g.18577  ORF Transcript_6341/g.18577 Transcript_6341/m.18577 type:complete len:112 (+) Transcript_6341:82-417(+)
MARLKPEDGVLQTLVVALVEPGTGHLLLPFINYSLCALLLTLAVVAAYGYGSIHLVVMAILALGLMASVNWFVAEFKRLEATANIGEAEGSSQQHGSDAAGDAPERQKKTD